MDFEQTSGLRLQRNTKRRWPFIVSALVILLVIGAGGAAYYMYSRPLPAPTLSLSIPSTPAATTPNLTWPREGTAAISGLESTFIASNADLHAKFSAASMIKLVTVLCILEKYPLKVGEQGPTLTMTAEDVSRVQHEIATQGNHINIVVGEQMSQYHAFEAVLIESSNSTTNTMAIWAFGSMEAYKTYATNWLKTHGLTETTLGNDASGTDPNNASTLNDMVKLGKIAYKNPVITKIIATPTATFQTHGVIKNRNKLLGNGILLGGKTGSLDDIKGSYLFLATTQNVNPAFAIPLVGVVAYDTSVQIAISDSEALAKSAASYFEKTSVVHAGQTVGELKTAWGQRIPITAQKDIEVTRWKGSPITLNPQLSDPVQAAGPVGTLSATVDGVTVESPLVTNESVSPPSTQWRITTLR